MPVYIKGGVWTNVEDEILRAAISKYGLNQWARVSSLLARKTAKQVKARWTEWLDPAIKKIEWSREEDEKLLHLAKLMPTQWRTIAPLVGRTATQCLERYQKLLDEAEAADNGLGLTGPGDEALAPTADQVRRLRPGEIDPDPENKPARPDAIDMDEDEKEMLSEARARLANTQGKKAKRKDRERLLEESRRLAVLQKRRELKQAGINVRLVRKNKNEMDYNADIPFEHRPAPGFYDTAEELSTNNREKLAFDARTKQRGAQRKDTGDDKKRQRDKDPAAAEKAALARAEKLQQLQEADQIAKRRKLSLPAPQIKEQELEEIVKIGSKEEQLKEYAEDGGLAEALVERGYTSKLNLSQPQRTPRVEQTEDYIYQASRDLRALTNTRSSLLGGENTPLHQGTGFKGSAPDRSLAETPNPLALSLGGGPADATPFATPRPAAPSAQSSLRSAFASLPKPKNDFELVLVDEEDEDAATVDKMAVDEDAGERDRRLAAEKQRELERALARRSSVIQRGLPRPKTVDAAALVAPAELDGKDPIRAAIMREYRALVVSDSLKYPVDGGAVVNADGLGVVDDLDDAVRDDVLALIAAEAAKDEHAAPHRAQLAAQLAAAEYELPGIGAALDPALDEDDVAETVVGALTTAAQSANKTEKKLQLLLGGYMTRHKAILARVPVQQQTLNEAVNKYEAFASLKALEDAALVSRTDPLEEEVNELLKIEREKQERYRTLSDVLNGLA
ncbi:pre-mRNA splicing factor component-domain-containing protein [Dipodascopsis tothii]|uniref:pre-mRNA splicing factor component-domain-containing protein n=1 Tax=Dipodascopsis tothii TaxID=44089 RepID=UPI0034CEBF4E